MSGLERLRRHCRALYDRAARRGEEGFTLLELLVVLAIIALLAGLVGPRVLDVLSGAKTDTAGLQIKNVEAALDLYRLDVGRYPTTDEGLSALMEKPQEAERWRGPYLKSADGLVDPWGAPYRYRGPGEDGKVSIFSYGADGREGGDGENADVHNN